MVNVSEKQNKMLSGIILNHSLLKAHNKICPHSQSEELERIALGSPLGGFRAAKKMGKMKKASEKETSAVIAIVAASNVSSELQILFNIIPKFY